MYTDKCEIQNVTRSIQFGETVLGTPFPSRCRVENEDEASEDSNGIMNHFRRIYFLPPQTVIKKGDNIKTTIQRSVNVEDNYTKVDEVFIIGGVFPHHLEVYVS